MHLIPAANAAWVFAASPSKVPFYVAGALLAGWAFGVAATGITRPRFASSARAGRLVVLAGVVFAAATVTTAVTTAGEPAEEHETPAAAAPADATLQLAADPSGKSAYDRTEAAVDSGPLTIRFTNASPLPHNVTIARGAQVVAATRTITGGSTAETTDLPAGSYVFYCSVDGHRQAGMRGTLTAG